MAVAEPSPAVQLSQVEAFGLQLLGARRRLQLRSPGLQPFLDPGADLVQEAAHHLALLDVHGPKGLTGRGHHRLLSEQVGVHCP